MTGKELINWIEDNDAFDLEIMADRETEIAGDTMTRDINPEIREVSGRGVISDDGTLYAIMTGDPDEVVVL